MQLHQDAEPLLVNKEVAAKMLGVGVASLNRLIAMQELVVVILGRKTLRITVESINLLIARRTQKN